MTLEAAEQLPLNALDQRVFVYGTLRVGYSNHWLLELINSRFLQTAKIKGVVYMSAGRSLPYLVLGEGLGLVTGEIYATDGAGLAHLDHFEGHPRLYERKLVDACGAGMVWVYCGNEIRTGAFGPRPERPKAAIEVIHAG